MALLIVLTTFLLLAAWFARYLVKHDKGEREPIRALWAAFGFGLLAVPIAMVLELLLLPDAISPATAWSTLFVAAMTVGVVEELAKALPLMFYIKRKRYFNEHTDGVLYFALAGLGFGLPENLLYTLQHGAGVGVSRLLMTPVFHAATTALIGYALAKYRLGSGTKAGVVGMTLAVIALHGGYDFLLFTGVPILGFVAVLVAVTLTAGMFMLYRYARSLDQMHGLSVVGNNSFCRSCGKANPKHNLYCSHCGNRA